MLIGIGHKMRSGKDTIAEYLVEAYGFKRFSWADPIKDACRIIFDFSEEQLYGTDKEIVDERWGRTPRWILQRFGSEACRGEIDRDIWVKSTKIRVNKYRNGNPDAMVVIPDVRFENEARSIKEEGGILWKVSRAPELLEGEASLHFSENELNDYDGWDVEIDNNGSLRSLRYTVDELIENSRRKADQRGKWKTE